MTSTHSSPEQNPKDPASQSRSDWRSLLAMLGLSLSKNKVVAITTLILMLVTLPLILLLMQGPAGSDIDLANQPIMLTQSFRGLVTFLTTPISIAGLILSAGLLFGFLHSRPALDVYHALPVRRPALFAGRFLAGYLLIAGPQLLTFATVLGLRLLPVLNLLSIGEVLTIAGQVALMSLAVYTTTVFAFVLTGTIFDALFLIFLLNIAWPATLATLDFFISQVLPGYTISNEAMNTLSRYLLLTPVGQFFAASYLPLSGLKALWWLGLCVILGGASWLIYQRRPSELAGKPFAYRAPFIALRFLASLVVGLFFGYLFHQFQAGLLSYTGGLLVGAFTTHLVIEVILSRGFTGLRRSLVSFAAYLLIFAIGTTVVATGLFGYDYRLPAEQGIVAAEITTDELLPVYQANNTIVYPVFKDPANVAIVRSIHAAYVDWLKNNVARPYSLTKGSRLRQPTPGYPINAAGMEASAIIQPELTVDGKPSVADIQPVSRMTSCRIAYRLASGQWLTRTYVIDFAQEPFASLISQLKKSPEYLLQQFVAFFQPAAQMPAISLLEKTGQPLFSLSNPRDTAKISQIQQALRQDLMQGAAQATNSTYIGNLTLDQSGANIWLSTAYKATIGVLQELGLLNNPEAVAERYETMYIARHPAGLDTVMEMQKLNADLNVSGAFNDYFKYTYTANYYPAGNASSPYLNNTDAFMQVSDPAQIKVLYQAGEKTWPVADTAATSGYLVLFAMRGQVQADGTISGSLPALYVPVSQIPAALLAQLQP